MRWGIVGFGMLVFVTFAQAQEIKAFWRCKDGHLQAVEKDARIDQQLVALYVNYQLNSEKGLRYSPISKSAMVDLPANVVTDSYIMLGGKGQWLMNCVGQVITKRHHVPPKLIFDVSKNAFGCPLIPRDCRASGSSIVLEDA